jgi:hypothetical protein
MSDAERSISPREIGLVPEDPGDFQHYFERAREISARVKDRADMSDDELIVLAVVASQLALARYVQSRPHDADETIDAILDILDRGDVVQAVSDKMTRLLSGRATMPGAAAVPIDSPASAETAHAVSEVPARKDEITTDEEAEIQYWTQLFGVNRHQLINAIQIVGTSVADVKRFLETGNPPKTESKTEPKTGPKTGPKTAPKTAPKASPTRANN